MSFHSSMAHPEHVAKLKQGVSVWNEWREQYWAKPCLIGADLIGADLTGADFSNAMLMGADLMGADLRRALLPGAHLAEADLTSANLNAVDLMGADLTSANLTRAHLNDTMLVGADLIGADLTNANLTRANLTNANLTEANLTRAILTDADLSRARLIRVDLSRAQLIRVDLSRAQLISADFTNARVDDANFSDATIGFTKFASIDLSRAKGLQTIHHARPSTIGIDTLYASGGEIPEVFLRGAGVPEDFITYVPILTEIPIEFYSCFISYSHEDKQFARRLHDTLQGRGIRCWLDEKQMLPGDDMYKVIEHGIRVWDKVLLCCSKHSLTSWWVDNEITTALAKEQQLSKQHGEITIVIIPLNLDGYLLSDNWDGDGKASLIKRRLAADFIGWEHNNAKFEQQFEVLMRALRTDAGGREPNPTPKLRAF